MSARLERRPAGIVPLHGITSPTRWYRVVYSRNDSLRHTRADHMITRRRFGITAACAFASVALGEGCALVTRPPDSNEGRLTARPRSDVATSLTSGALGLASDRDAVVQMPTTPR